MRKSFVVLLLGVFALGTGCSGSRIEVRPPAADVLDGTAVLGKIGADVRWLGTPIRFRSGDAIPVRVGVDMPFLRLREETVHLVALRDFYVLFTLPDADRERFYAERDPEKRKSLLGGLRVLFSSDGLRWAPLDALDDLKDVFQVRDGDFSVSLSLTLEAGFVGELRLRTK